ncbi:hypothetical protein ES288_D05G292400v1, partial [Gossypium darwinii]
KLNSFLRPKLQGLARNKGISFVPIDQSRPLSDQGPFDIVLHKMTGREWRQILEEYRQTHPKVLVLDPPDAIQHLHNRQSMLQCVADMNLFESYGGVLFKVFIVGEAIKVVRRFSLPDVTIRELSTNVGVYQFPRVSCAAACADDADLDPSVADMFMVGSNLSLLWGLRLFNLDIIREHGTRDHFYVLDINYFPGYGKMPRYEQIFTDFILNLMNRFLQTLY